jgi:hypothetical protein
MLKGGATARLLYADPSQRSSRDIDVLVRPVDLEGALRALAPITAEDAEVQAGPVRAAILKERQITDTRGVAIDVHQAIEGSLITSRLPTEPLFAEPQMFVVHGVHVQACSAAVMFVHSVLHSTSGGAQLSTLPDLARLARLVRPDDDIVAELLAARGPRELFAWSLCEAERRVPLPEPWRRYSELHQPSRARQRLFRAVHGSEARLGLINVLIGERRLRRVREVLWPTRAYLQFKSTTRLGNLRWVLRRGGEVIRGR